MTTDDDDDLGIDLDAWQPPPVPGGIADAVVAQLRQEHTAITTVTAIDTERRGGKRLWLIAIPLVAAAAAGLVAFGIRRAPANGQGTIVAERPMHLAIGPSSAELDPGTHVTWKRTRDRITATQTGGAATWRVGDDDTLTIDAAVAKIEATNASLRVEVQMIDDKTKKTVATSAVTAAAVALVTIVVYEGAVKATESGKTTEVAAGTTYRIKGPTVIEEEADTVGASIPPTNEVTVDERDVAAPPASLSRTEIQRVMGELAPKLQACNDGHDGRIIATVTVGASGAVERVETSPPGDSADCVAGVIEAATFTKTGSVTKFKYPLVFSTPTAACDFDELYAKGQDAYSAGSFAQALAAFEAAYRCRADNQALKLAFAAACRSKNLSKAQLYWRKLSQSMRDQVLSVCVGSGITPDELNAKRSTGHARIVGPDGARISVDGAEVGVGTASLELSAGKHKVTFRVGDDRHTFSIIVTAGRTTTLDRHALE